VGPILRYAVQRQLSQLILSIFNIKNSSFYFVVVVNPVVPIAQELDSKGWKAQEDMDLEKNVGHSR